MSLIKLVSTGGTIANTSQDLIAINEVLKDIPEAGKMADFEITEATRVRSGSMRLGQWLDIARTVRQAADDSRADGVIVTHGTFRGTGSGVIFAIRGFRKSTRGLFT